MPENVGFLSVFFAARRANGKMGGQKNRFALSGLF